MTPKERRFVLPALALLGAVQAAAAAQDPREVFRKVSASVVAVRALAPLGERSGSGTVLTEDGLILPSYSVCPEGAKDIAWSVPYAGSQFGLVIAKDA